MSKVYFEVNGKWCSAIVDSLRIVSTGPNTTDEVDIKAYDPREEVSPPLLYTHNPADCLSPEEAAEWVGKYWDNLGGLTIFPEEEPKPTAHDIIKEFCR